MATPTAYDDLSYESLAYPQTHPDRLATVATLFGLRPAPVDGCRVLEIACAAGGNLLPMATMLPGSDFVGVDLSAAQIAEARRAGEALRLGNVRWEAMSFEAISEQLGTFDYVIAHGLYSWIPKPLQGELLAVISRILRPAGVAYISYNTYPGWQTRRELRNMVLFHTRPLQTVAEKLTAARSLFAFWEGALHGREDAFARGLLEELAQLRELGDFYIAHEYLEEVSDGCHFHEFVSSAEQHGLQFLGEAEMQTMSAAEFPPAVREGLRGLAGNIVQAEQHLDFLRNRAFRQTLLCRAEVEIKRAIPPERLLDLHIAMAAWPREGGTGFYDADGLSIRATDPFANAALEELSAAWPQSIHFPELVSRASQRSGIRAEAGAVASVANCLIACYAVARGMEFTVLPRHFLQTVSERPQASALARWQAATTGRVTNARHENIVLGPTERAVLVKLDGTRTVADLTREHGEVETLLKRFAKGALLVG